MGTTEESLFGDFQNLNGLISRDGGKVLEEIVDTISGLKAVEEGLHRHAGTGEYGCSPEDVRR